MKRLIVDIRYETERDLIDALRDASNQKTALIPSTNNPEPESNHSAGDGTVRYTIRTRTEEKRCAE